MFFLFILAFIAIIFIAIHTSKMQLEIKNLKIDTEQKNIINEDKKIYFYFLIFKKIRILKKEVEIQKIREKGLNIKVLEGKGIKMNYIELLKHINPDKFELYVQIGTQNAALTAVLVGIISILISTMIKKPKYEIIPIYLNKNLLKIELNCIISIDFMHYIYETNSKLIKRRIRNGRTSNRKPYANCYE